MDEGVPVRRDLIGGEEEWLECCGQILGKTHRISVTYVKQAMQVLEDDPFVLEDDEMTEPQAALGVFVKLVHVAEGLKDGTEVDRAAENTSDGVPACPDWTHERVAFETFRLRELRKFGARVRAAEYFARKL